MSGKFSFKLFSVRETQRAPESERFYCAVHGDLSRPGELGGARFGDYSKEPFCPHCLGEWLSKHFPTYKAGG